MTSSTTAFGPPMDPIHSNSNSAPPLPGLISKEFDPIDKSDDKEHTSTKAPLCNENSSLFIRYLSEGAKQASKVSKVLEVFGRFAAPDVGTVTTIFGILDKVLSMFSDEATIAAQGRLNEAKDQEQAGVSRDVFIALYALHGLSLPNDVRRFVVHCIEAIEVISGKRFNATNNCFEDLDENERTPKRLFSLSLHIGADLGAICYRTGRLTQFFNLIKPIQELNPAAGWLLTIASVLAIPQLVLEGMNIFTALQFRKKLMELFPEGDPNHQQATQLIDYLIHDETPLKSILMNKFDIKKAYKGYYEEVSAEFKKAYTNAKDGEADAAALEAVKAEHKKLKGRVKKIIVSRIANITTNVCDIAGGVLGGASMLASAVPYLGPASLACHVLGNIISLANLGFKHWAIGDGHDLACTKDWEAVDKYFRTDRKETQKKLKTLKKALKNGNVNGQHSKELKEMFARLSETDESRLAVLFKRNKKTIKTDIETIDNLLNPPPGINDTAERQELAMKEAIRYCEKAIFWRRFKPILRTAIQVSAVVINLSAMILGMAVPEAMPASLAVVASISVILVAQPIIFHFYEKSNVTSREAREAAGTFVAGWTDKLSDKIKDLYARYLVVYKKHLKEPILSPLGKKIQDLIQPIIDAIAQKWESTAASRSKFNLKVDRGLESLSEKMETIKEFFCISKERPLDPGELDRLLMMI